MIILIYQGSVAKNLLMESKLYILVYICIVLRNREWVFIRSDKKKTESLLERPKLARARETN